MYTLILLAGGTGSRMNYSIPKQFLMLAGKPIIMHTLERIDRIEEIDEVIIVCHKGYMDLVSSYLQSYGIRTTCHIVSGGASRQESTFIGLKHAINDMVLVHEAARPFVTVEEFKKIIALPSQNVTFGIPLPFTVLEGTEKVTSILDRSKLVNIQLPQKFNKNELLSAHKKAKIENKSFTEDASLLFYYANSDIEILPGSSRNIKITDPIDLLIGELIYKEYIVRRV